MNKIKGSYLGIKIKTVKELSPKTAFRSKRLDKLKLKMEITSQQEIEDLIALLEDTKYCFQK